MSNKRMRGNKEVKKPKQEPRVLPPPPAVGSSTPTLTGWQPPHRVKK
jgi:hypothetical protein